MMLHRYYYVQQHGVNNACTHNVISVRKDSTTIDIEIKLRGTRGTV